MKPIAIQTTKVANNYYWLHEDKNKPHTLTQVKDIVRIFNVNLKESNYWENDFL